MAKKVRKMSKIRKGIIVISIVAVLAVVVIFFSLEPPFIIGGGDDPIKIDPVEFPNPVKKEMEINKNVEKVVRNDFKSQHGVKDETFKDVTEKIQMYPRYDFQAPEKRFIAHTSTDKKIYQVGDTIFIRVVLLNAFDHSPLFDSNCTQLKEAFKSWTGPPKITLINGMEQEQFKFGMDIERSVLSGKWKIPKNQGGGTYKIKLDFPEYGYQGFYVVSAMEREIEIQNYIPKRYKKSIEFPKRGYAEGELVEATVRFEKSEGGFPSMKNAIFKAIAKVDGMAVVEMNELHCNEEGKLEISFLLPQHIEVGEGSLTVIIKEGITESITKTIPITLKKVNVKIYPEGGDLIEGLNNGVYIEVKDFKDDPIDYTANLINEHEKIIVNNIKSLHEGRSFFQYTHEKDVIYYLQLTTPIKQLIPLPIGKKKGVTITMSEKKSLEHHEDIIVEVSSTNKQDIYVCLFKKERYLDIQKVSLNYNERKTITLTKKNIDGVLRITILSNHYKPLAERLVFVHPKDELDISIVPDKSTYVPGGKVVLTVNAKSKVTQNVLNERVRIGVTVTDDSTYKMSDRRERHPTLFSQVFLESEINEKESLFDSDGYFDIMVDEEDLNEIEPSIRLDLLMGTQGWRKFLYSKDINNKNVKNLIKRILIVSPEQHIYYHQKKIHNWTNKGRQRFGIMKNIEMPAQMEVMDMPMPGEMIDDMAIAAMDNFEAIGGEGVVLMEMEKEEEKIDIDIDIAPDDNDNDNDNDDDVGVIKGKIGKIKRKRKKRLFEEARAPMRFNPPNEKVQMLEYERIYANGAKSSDLDVRTNFMDTLFYSAFLEMNSKWEKKIEFYLNDQVGSFRIFVDAYSDSGIIGACKSVTINSVRPFFIEPKIPKEITNRDEVVIPILVVSNVNEVMYVDITPTIIGMPKGEISMLFAPGTIVNVELKPHERKELSFNINIIEYTRNDLQVHIEAEAKLKTGEIILKDKLTRDIKIVSSAFPLIRDYGGTLKKNSPIKMYFTMPTSYQHKTLMTYTKIYSTPAASLTEGLKSLIRRPCGCFEQTSNSMYPLIMAKQYFSTHEKARKEATEGGMISESQMDEFIEEGYLRLLSYECNEKGGFEWFGRSPPHEALTSLGIMEYVDLSNVYTPSKSSIEHPKSVLKRATKWILSRIDGDTIKLSDKKLDSFGYAPRFITEVYIMYALSSSKVIAYEDVSLVMEKLLKDSLGKFKSDSYYIGMLALSLYNFEKFDQAKAMVERLIEFQDATTGKVMKSTTSVTKSSGVNLDVETTSIGVLNFINHYEDYQKNAELGMKYILSQNKNGRFGSTQATVLALKSIIEFDEKNKAPKQNGILKLYVNGILSSEKKIKAGNVNPIFMDDFSDALINNGVDNNKNVIELEMINGTQMPFSLQIMMYTEDVTQLSMLKKEKLIVDAFVNEDGVEEGSSIGIGIKIKNLEDEDSGMAVFILSIPGGLEVDFDHLKELKRSKSFDHFELFGNEIVFYWVGLKRKTSIDFTVRCTAIQRGIYYAKPSRSYLYYEDDEVYYTEPYSISIEEGMLKK